MPRRVNSRRDGTPDPQAPDLDLTAHGLTAQHWRDPLFLCMNSQQIKLAQRCDQQWNQAERWRRAQRPERPRRDPRPLNPIALQLADKRAWLPIRSP